MTLIELLIAITLNTMIISSVFFLWRAINVHVIETRRKEIFNTETQRIVLEVVSLLQRSPRIITFDHTSITFISHRNADTSRIDLYFGRLRRDLTPIPSAVQGGVRTTEFTIEDQPMRTDNVTSAGPALLTVSFRFKNAFNDSSAYILNVSVTLSQRKDENEEYVPDEF
jgi:hypothetical protein